MVKDLPEEFSGDLSEELFEGAGLSKKQFLALAKAVGDVAMEAARMSVRQAAKDLDKLDGKAKALSGLIAKMQGADAFAFEAQRNVAKIMGDQQRSREATWELCRMVDRQAERITKLEQQLGKAGKANG